MKAAGISPSALRRDWPQHVLRQVLEELMQEAPADMIAREIFAGSAGPTDWWSRQRAFATSAAVMSMVCF